MKPTLAAATVALLGGCILDAAPSIPEATDGGSLVVPDRRSDAEVAREDQGSVSVDHCASLCPRQEARSIAQCHPTRLEPRLERHRSHLGEPIAGWIVCYYEVD